MPTQNVGVEHSLNYQNDSGYEGFAQTKFTGDQIGTKTWAKMEGNKKLMRGFMVWRQAMKLTELMTDWCRRV